MSNGAIIFAYNSRQVDYAKISLISAKLAQKNLDIPVSLITDQSTVDWMKESGIHPLCLETFDQIIIDDIEDDHINQRLLSDGLISEKIPFRNQNRFKAWDLTPYDRTLVLDSDYLILTNNLLNYWNVDEDFLISNGVKDLYAEDRFKHHDRYISDSGIKLFWATTILFTKNDHTRLIFDYLKHIKGNYNQYSEIYRFDHRIYRNDFVFSIAHHVFNGYRASNNNLPELITTLDKDILIDIDKDFKLKFLLEKSSNEDYVISTASDIDIHVMNKQSLVRNFEKFMDLI